MAVAVGKVVGDINVDAIQPTRNGWQIYVKMEKDRAVLIATGLNIAGKHVLLESHTFPANNNVKITIKDLPLNEVSNEEVLEGIKALTPVSFPVKYCNIWIDGHHTHLCNRDHFFVCPLRTHPEFTSNHDGERYESMNIQTNCLLKVC